MSLNVKQTGPTEVVVLDDSEQVAEIRDLKLVSARFRAGGPPLIGESYPLFLFWMQYANHEDPERNTGSQGIVEIASQNPDLVAIKCSGSNASMACSSQSTLTIRRLQNPVRYQYSVQTSLDVQSGGGWRVTPNASQGEVEFANLWPDKTFSVNPGEPKLYQACFVVTPAGVGKIPHHHLETSDKHNIKMNSGDKFMWLEEAENLCCTIITEHSVTAGVCAYMWDAHFAFKVCSDGNDVLLPAGTHFEAAFELTSIDAKEARSMVERAVDRPAPEIATIPLYVGGVNHFRRTLQNAGPDLRYVWPWETESDGVSIPVFDLAYGFDDSSCLRIDSKGNGTSCWKVTTIGPAFGGRPFVDGAQYQLSAIVKAAKLEGKTRISIRLHKDNQGNVFDLQTYETYTSARMLHGDSDWRLLRALTPPISPVPDRLHILLIQEGSGTTWFDDVHLEALT